MNGQCNRDYTKSLNIKVFHYPLYNLQVGPNSFEIVRQYTSNFKTLQMEVVKEEHIKQGIRMLYEEEEELVVEGGGAITLAACQYNLQEHLRGKK